MKIQKIPFLFLSLMMISFLCSFNIVKPIEKPKEKKQNGTPTAKEGNATTKESIPD
jgi:hypothetical protein